MSLLWLLAAAMAAGPLGKPVPLPLTDYPDTAAARKAWQPMFGSLPVRLERSPDGSRCIVLEAVFNKSGDRVCWDWHGRLDLSAAGRVSFEVSADRPLGGLLGIYFGTPGGWYAAFRPAPLSVTWTPVILDLRTFKTEQRPEGWDKITVFRFSVWGPAPGRVTYRIRNFAALPADPAENFMKNGSFEIVTAGMPYAWGSGHWGLGHLPWATDTDLWRKHWHTDDTTAKHGRRSLCIENTADLPRLSAYSVWITPPQSVKTVTVSAWLKSDRDELPVVLQCTDRSRRFQVGRAWKQVALKAIPRRKRMTVIIAPKAAGTLWIDAVQMQAGDAATADFHPSVADAIVEAREKFTDWSPPRRTPDIARGRTITGPVKPARVEIDRHGRLLVGGQPYLQHSVGLEFVSDLRIIDFLAHSGFSDVCIHFPPHLSLARIQEIFDRCASAGLRLIAWLNRGFTRQKFTEIITALKNHPALLAWYVYDEPFGARLPEAEARYRLAKQLDDAHPVFINYPNDILKGQVGDIYSTDLYPIPHSTPLAAINAVARMAAAAAREHKPVWMWLQGTGYAYWMDREPSPRELSCMVYGSLINGARGIYYFAQIPRSKPCWEEMRALCVELARLTPVVYSLQTPPRVRCDDKAILWRAFRYRDAAWILAVNTSRVPRRARFYVPRATGRVEVVFEGRSLSARKGIWSDDFGQYERHVYRLTVR